MYGKMKMEVIRMYDYIKGMVAGIGANYIVIDNNGLGFKIFTPNPFAFQEETEEKIYIHHIVKEEEFSFYGFKSLEERDLFLRLISVKGLGAKMAMPMLASGSVAGIIDAIDRENILYLKKFPKIGDKVARQIILDLKGKLTQSETTPSSNFDELVNVLESLGYKNADIKKILPKIDANKEIEQQIKDALKLLLK